MEKHSVLDNDNNGIINVLELNSQSSKLLNEEIKRCQQNYFSDIFSEELI